MKRKLGIFVDLNRCVGCYACAVACKEINQLPPGMEELPPIPSINWIQIETHTPEGKFPDPGLFFVPKHCNHCENAPCVEACPTGASFKRDDGIVLVDAKICTGCQDCIEACPYDQRFYNAKRGVVEKCTFCVDLIDKGEQPACVSTCVGGAMYLGDLNDPKSDIVKRIKKLNKRESYVLVASMHEDPRPCVIYEMKEQLDEKRN